MHGFGRRSVAPRSRRGKKRAPLRNAREPSRYRAWPNAQNHSKVSRSSTRNSHTLPRIITSRTPFSPNRMPKRKKGYHFARATERHHAETTQTRQKLPAPPPAPCCCLIRSRLLTSGPYKLGRLAAKSATLKGPSSNRGSVWGPCRRDTPWLTWAPARVPPRAGVAGFGTTAPQ